MSIHGIIIVNLLGLGLIILVFNLVRTHKLHVGYAVIWLLSITGSMVITLFPPLLSLLPKLVGASFPASALSLLAFAFIFLLLIFISVQLSTLSARQIEIIQTLALNELLAQENHPVNPGRNDELQDGVL
jgi:hypothetical protein